MESLKHKVISFLLVFTMCFGLPPNTVNASNAAVVLDLFQVSESSHKSDNPSDYYTITANIECPLCGNVTSRSRTLSRWDSLKAVISPVESGLIPSNTGFTFAGWYDEAGAPWTAPGESVTVDPEDDSVSGPGYEVIYPGNSNTVQVIEGTTNAIVSPQNSDQETSVQTQQTPLQDITIYSRWTAPEGAVQINYSTSIHQEQCHPTLHFPGKPIKNLPELKSEDSTFLGWYSNCHGNEVKWTEDTVVVGGLTLYAKWSEEPPRPEIETISVSYDFNDGVTPYLIESWTGPGPFKLTPPELPERSGYNFIGWFDANGQLWDFEQDLLTQKTFLTAYWERIVEKPGETFSFNNSHAYFGEKYSLSDPYFRVLVDNNNYFGNTSANWAWWQSFRDAKWDGACFGMAAVYCLAHLDQLNPGTFQSNAALLNDLDFPKNNINVRDLIHYYFLMQLSIPTGDARASFDPINESTNLQNLIATLDTSGEYVLLGVDLRGRDGERRSGHAIVAERYVIDDNENYKVTIWDPNYPDELHYLTFDQNFRNPVFDYRISVYPVTFVKYSLEPEDYDYMSLTSIWQGEQPTSGTTSNYSVLSLTGDDFRIRAGNNQYATVENGMVTSGNLQITECTPDGITADGLGSSQRSFFIKAASGQDITLEIEDGTKEVSLLSGSNFYTVNGDVSRINFTPDAISTVAEGAAQQTITIVSDTMGNTWNKLSVSGKDTAFSVSLSNETAQVVSAHNVTAAVVAENVTTGNVSDTQDIAITPAGVNIRTDASLGIDETGQTEDFPFSDVRADAYYYDAVRWAVKNNVTTGTSATTFSPDSTCTRSQVVTFLWRAMGQPAPKTATNPFVDVKPEDFYYKAVLWAYENGITAGTSATTFAPGDACTRGQVVTFLWRAEEKPIVVDTGVFKDVPASAYYADAVNWAVKNGITTGTGSTTFSPDAVCTRAQIVTFLYRDMM